MALSPRDQAIATRWYRGIPGARGRDVPPDAYDTIYSVGNGITVGLDAPDRAAVDAAHKAGLSAGGKDEGAPGLRTHYHPNYYGAYLRDPDGNKICVVCHKPA